MVTNQVKQGRTPASEGKSTDAVCGFSMVILCTSNWKSDVLQCQEALFEWAESFDTKDWDRLGKCIAPTLYVSFRVFSQHN